MNPCSAGRGAPRRPGAALVSAVALALAAAACGAASTDRDAGAAPDVGSTSSSGGGSTSGSGGGSSSSSGGGSSSSSGGGSPSSSGGSSSGSTSSGGPLPSGTLHVSPTGTATATGTEDQPLDLETAIAKVAPGGTIAMKGGTYPFSKQITIARAASGEEGAVKHLVAAPGARVILDFSSQAASSGHRGIVLDAHWWHVKGIEIVGAADNGLYLSGSHDTIEACTFRGNRDSGLQISGSSSVARADWPSHNLVLNCEAYDNSDASGENADGFACKLTAGPGNVFRGCVAHHNSDDGWDLYTKAATGPISPVVIDRCVAFENGTLTDGAQLADGDRNGFKLGGDGLAVAHVITRSIAFANGKNGFTWNSNPGVIWVVNNTAWDNAQGNFKFDDASAAVFVNNASFWTTGAGRSDRAGASGGTVVASNAFWDESKGTLWGFGIKAGSVVTAGAFRSVAAPRTYPLPRLADGSFDLGGLGKLAATSVLVDVGLLPTAPPGAGAALPFDPGAYYAGTPDAGAIEAR